MVAQRIAKAVSDNKRKITVGCAMKNWPMENMPDILVASQWAAKEGLQPVQSEDEITRSAAIMRIKGTELLVLDEADLLMASGTMQSLLIGYQASLPAGLRKILPEATRFYSGGVPVKYLDKETLEWVPAHAQPMPQGKLTVSLDDTGEQLIAVHRRYVMGPGISLLQERGMRVVLAAATVPDFHKDSVEKMRKVPNKKGKQA